MTETRFRSLLFLTLMVTPSFGSVVDQVSDSGVPGGLVVHLGCGDGQQTAKLLINDRFTVHGLDTDRDKVQAARDHLRSGETERAVALAELAIRKADRDIAKAIPLHRAAQDVEGHHNGARFGPRSGCR